MTKGLVRAVTASSLPYHDISQMGVAMELVALVRERSSATSTRGDPTVAAVRQTTA